MNWYATEREARMEEKLTGLSLWLQGVLETKLQHQGYADPSGHPHGGAVAVIPDWEVRQHLDEIKAALATDPPGHPAAPTRPEGTSPEGCQ